MDDAFTHGVTRKFNSGHLISGKQQTHLIVQGYVALYGVSAHKNTLILILGPGEVLPLLYEADQISDNTKVQYKTLTPVTLSSVDTHIFYEQLLTHARLLEDYIRQAQNRTGLIMSRLINLNHSNVSIRLYNRLLFLADHLGQIRGRRIVLGLPLSHAAIAESIGSTRETVNRLMSKLQEEKIITVKKRVIVVNSIEELKRLAASWQ